MNIPNHIAIIMDGNGRWALNKGKKRSEGHKKGAEALEKIASYAKEIGVKYLSVYAFSTDNFKRSQEEVDYLMNLLVYYFKNKLPKVCKDGIKVLVSGKYNNLSKEVITAIKEIEEKTKNNQKCILNICLNYGGQEEIVDASYKLAEDLNKGVITKNELNREVFYKYLYQNLPPIDLLIRTGGEKRLSNFMLYQMFYAEIYFSDTLFPDFKENELDDAIKFFNTRDRRYGNVKTN